MTRQGRPVGLIIAAVAVLAAGLLLLLIMQSGDDDDASAAAVRPAPGSSGAAVAGDRPRPTLDGTDGPQVSATRRTRPRPAPGEDPGYTETVVDGVRVRDHRKDRSAPVQISTGGRPSSARKIQSSLTTDISNKILPIVRECSSGVPPEARGVKPRVQGEVVIAIRNKQVHITGATIQLTEVVGASLEPTKQCIEQKTAGLTLPAGDEADLEDYSISLSYGLF